MLTFFTVSNATSTMTSVGTYSSAMFSELLPVLYVVAGLLIGGMIVAKIIGATVKGAKKVVGGSGKGRSRRRY